MKNVDAFVNPKGTKWELMFDHATSQALAANNGLGCCGKTLVFCFNTLDRIRPGWEKKNNSVTAKLWNLIKKRNGGKR